jgi:hypothetical protein
MHLLCVLCVFEGQVCKKMAYSVVVRCVVVFLELEAECRNLREGNLLL